MIEYNKIQTIYKRDLKTKKLLLGQWSTPEFEYLQNTKWIFTEKVDGTNIRIHFDGEKITFGARSENSQIPAILSNRLNEKFLPMIDVFRSKFDGAVTLYGEGYGKNIQKVGDRYRQDQDFILFDVLINGYWLERHSIVDIAKTLALDVVPIIGQGSLFDAEIMAANGFNSQWGDFPAEGIVARPACELKTRGGERIIAKIKSRDF